MERKKLPAGTSGSHAPKNLSTAQVADMRRLRGDGAKLKELAGRFGVTESAVSRICNGKAHGPLEAR